MTTAPSQTVPRWSRPAILTGSILGGLAASLWAASCFHLTWTFADNSGLIACSGAAGVWWSRLDAPRPAGHVVCGPEAGGYEGFSVAPLYRSHTAGFVRVFEIGLWAPFLIGIWLAGAGLRPLRRHRRGRCIRCAYDLQGSTSRCPECGRQLDPGHA